MTMPYGGFFILQVLAHAPNFYCISRRYFSPPSALASLKPKRALE